MKRITALITLILMLFTLCGCEDIDEIRKITAFVQKDGNIKYDGKLFIPYETDSGVKYGYDVAHDIKLGYDGEPLLWPVVLEAQNKRDSYNNINKQKTVMAVFNYSQMYFREDVYDELVNEYEELCNGNGIVAYVNYALEEREIRFSKEDSEALLEIFNYPVLYFGADKLFYDDYGDFYKRSSNGTFYENVHYDLAEDGGKYYIVDQTDTDAEVYLATGRAEEVIKDIMKKVDASES